MSAPADAPPTYSQATGSSTAPKKASTLGVPSIPHASRRSMEDEQRPLPSGWVRQYDKSEGHQFFVDTKANPPRSIWHHPYDDDQYLSTLSSEDRERIQEEERQRAIYLHSDDEAEHSPDSKSPMASSGSSSKYPQELPARPGNDRKDSKAGKPSLGERLKEKVTGQTKEERAREKAKREEEDRVYYEAHQKFRIAMQKAAQTGQPQWLARDREGKDVYVEPPNYGGGMGRYGNSGVGMNPYTNGPYSDPNARYIRPQYDYGRPGYYGGGYGGGMYGRSGYGYGGMGGMGMGMPIAGGLLGGMMLGGLMF